MLQFTLIGNLGSDARVMEQDGRKFVSFNVAHSDSWKDDAGQVHRSTQWVSCALNGDGGALLPYLVKGKSVFVSGRGSCRVYSSPKERRMVAGLNISVDHIELLPGSSDVVPRRLVDSNAVLVDVNKAYYVPQEVAKAAGATKNKRGVLRSEAGVLFEVDNLGFVYQSKQAAQEQSEEEAAGNLV